MPTRGILPQRMAEDLLYQQTAPNIKQEENGSAVHVTGARGKLPVVAVSHAAAARYLGCGRRSVSDLSAAEPAVEPNRHQP